MVRLGPLHRGRSSKPTDQFVVDVTQCSCRIAFEGRLGRAYNEEAFQYLLQIHRNRAEQSGRSILLVLVSADGPVGTPSVIPHRVAAKIFATFWDCLRDVDFAGWFRTDNVAAAVVTDVPEGASAAISRVQKAVARLLETRIPARTGTRLDVRVTRLPAPWLE